MASLALACALVATWHASLSSALCMWKPSGVYFNSHRRFYFDDNDEPVQYDNFSAAEEACSSKSSCRWIVCGEDFCTAPAGGDRPGRRYRSLGSCYRPKVVTGYCNRRAWYKDNPCNTEGPDYCCERDCETCGPADYCVKSIRVHARQCDPDYRQCNHYYQACDQPPNGRPTVDGANLSVTSPPPTPAPMAVVQLGGGAKTISCSRHGLSPIISLAMCELVAQAFGQSQVQECSDEKKCAMRPYGCILQTTGGDRFGDGLTALMNEHGQVDSCGVGSDAYDVWDCLCISNPPEAGPDSGMLPEVDRKRRKAEHEARAAEEKAESATKEAAEAKAAAATAGNEVSEARMEALRAQQNAEKASKEADEAQRVAAQRLAETRAHWQSQQEIMDRLTTELEEWKATVEKNMSKQSDDADGQDAAHGWAAAIEKQQEAMARQQHLGLAFVGGLTSLLLVAVVCALGVAFVAFRYAGPSLHARGVRDVELQDALVQSEPTAEFSPM